MNGPNLEVRLQTLEKQMNRYRLTTTVLAIACVGLVGIAATAPKPVSDEVRAKKFVVVDEQGKEAAHLSSGPFGGILNIHNRGGNTVVVAGAAEKGGKLLMADDQGNQFVKVTVEETGGQLLVQDQKGQKHTITASTPK